MILMWLFLWFYIMVLLITNYKLMLEMHDVISEFLLQALYLRNGTKDYYHSEIQYWLSTLKIFNDGVPARLYLFVWPTVLMIYLHTRKEVRYMTDRTNGV